MTIIHLPIRTVGIAVRRWRGGAFHRVDIAACDDERIATVCGIRDHADGFSISPNAAISCGDCARRERRDQGVRHTTNNQIGETA
jgi:hypothetical protein